LHNEEFYKFYSLTNTIRMIKPKRIIWVGHVAGMWRRGTRKDLWYKARRKEEDNARVDLREIRLSSNNWIHLAQDKGHHRAL
jgi:hypothetical protein